jgi:hemerythrin-like domain-containing protein
VKLIFQSLDEALKADMILEEKILFPYLETHIPKLKFMIHIIEEEHEDLRRNLAAFRLLLEALFSKRPDRVKEGLIEKMRRKGRYLGYFLHNHTLAENETVYRVIETELNAREKEELNECFNSYRIRVNCFLN